MHEKLIMKLCTENDMKTVQSALISLKLPIKRTIIKIPATTSGHPESGFPVRTKGVWLKETG